MFFNARTIAFSLASIISLLSLLILPFTTQIDYNQVFIFTFVEFLLVFLLSFFTFEILFFQEFKRIREVLNKTKFETTIEDNLKPQSTSNDVLNFVKEKQKKIAKLKQLETFRKDFLADISHELKTPIFSAQGFIHTLLDGAINDPSVCNRFLEKAGKNLDQLDILTQDLSTISQLETGYINIEPENFSINQLITEVVDLLDPKRASKDCTISIDAFKENITTFADRNKISQVLKNIIVNAIKYGNDQGKIKIKLIDVNKKVKIQIRDNGPGIASNHLDKIFRRFYRVEKSRSRELGGTGLGLAIVKHIIEAHGTKINVSSKLNKGTVFTFELQKG